MAKTTKAKKSTSKNILLRRRPSFNKIQLAVLVVALVAIGGFLFIRFSHAASCESSCVAVSASALNNGYWVLGKDGSVYDFNAHNWGGVPQQKKISNAAGMVATSDGTGYWVTGSNGAIYAFGAATNYGSLAGKTLAKPIVGIARTPTNKGYWLVGADGGVFAFGDAAYKGGLVGKSLAGPIEGIASTPSGQGYWLVGADGGVFAFGDAAYKGSLAGKQHNGYILGISRTATGNGYWLVGTDGGVYSYGDAQFYGSMGGKTLKAPVNSIATSPTGKGYWLSGTDGAIYAFGDAAYEGSLASIPNYSNPTHFVDSFYYFPNGTYTDIKASVVIKNDPTPDGYFFSNTFYFENNAVMGYMGLQTIGGPSAGKNALFSIWGATAAKGSGIVETFDEGGKGWHVSVDYPWVVNHTYRLRIVKGTTDSTGVWWNGYVMDQGAGFPVDNGPEKLIGSIKAPLNAGNLSNTIGLFHERYLGPTTSCSILKPSTVTFALLSANGKPPAYNTLLTARDNCSSYYSSSADQYTTVSTVK